jgi:hypothetical protein
MRAVARWTAVLAALYLALAVRGLVRESRGELRCECRPDCWCKKPGLQLFRWVFPVWHSLPR